MEHAVKVERIEAGSHSGRNKKRIKKAAELYILHPEKTATKILLEAGYASSTANGNQSRVFESPIFKNHLAEKQAQLRDDFKFEISEAYKMLMGAYEKAKAEGDSSSMIKAVDSLCHLFGVSEKVI